MHDLKEQGFKNVETLVTFFEFFGNGIGNMSKKDMQAILSISTLISFLHFLDFLTIRVSLTKFRGEQG